MGSAEACCQSHFSWKKATCLKDSLDPPGIQQYNTNAITVEVQTADSSDGDTIYYPVFGQSLCKGDGQEPDFFKPSDLHVSAEACCDKHFDWKKDECLRNTLQTEVPTEEPTNKPSRQPSKSPTKEPTKQPTSNEADISTDALNGIYYPVFSQSLCKGDGQQPDFFKPSDLHVSAEVSPLLFPTSLLLLCVRVCAICLPHITTIDKCIRQACCDKHFDWKKDKCLRNTLQTEVPTEEPTNKPSQHPSKSPTKEPTKEPSQQPSKGPTSYPSRKPSHSPTRTPSHYPSTQPSRHPTQSPEIHTAQLNITALNSASSPTVVGFNTPVLVPSKGKEQQVGEKTKNPLKKTKQGSKKISKKKSSFTIIPQSEPQVVEYTPVPNKGKGKQSGDSTKNQVQKAKKGQEKSSKKKKEENKNPEKSPKKTATIKAGKRKPNQKTQRTKLKQKKLQQKRKQPNQKTQRTQLKQKKLQQKRKKIKTKKNQ